MILDGVMQCLHCCAHYHVQVKHNNDNNDFCSDKPKSQQAFNDMVGLLAGFTGLLDVPVRAAGGCERCIVVSMSRSFQAHVLCGYAYKKC